MYTNLELKAQEIEIKIREVKHRIELCITSKRKAQLENYLESLNRKKAYNQKVFSKKQEYFKHLVDNQNFRPVKLTIKSMKINKIKIFNSNRIWKYLFDECCGVAYTPEEFKLIDETVYQQAINNLALNILKLIEE